MEQEEKENCQIVSHLRRGPKSTARPPESGSHGYRCIGALALTFCQLSIAFICILMVITLTSQNAQAGAWDPEEEISTDINPEWQRYPSIAVDGDQIHVVWEDGGDGDADVYYRHFNGTAWEPEQEISTDIGSEIQVSPSIATDGGKVHVVWENWRDGDSDIFYRCFNGTDWQPEIELSSDSSNEAQWNPSIAAEGNVIYVVWEDREGGDLDIMYRHYNGTAWEPEQEISSDAANEDQREPSIAVEGGEIHAVWEDREDEDFDIHYRHFKGTGWLPEEEISVDLGSENQWNPSVATEASKVHCVWEHEAGLDYDIHYRINNGSGWEPVFEVSSDSDSEAQRYPAIAANGSAIHTAWMDAGDGDVDIYYRSFNGTDWQSEQEISTDIGTEYQWNPSMVAIGNEVHVVWHDSGEGDDDIYYRHFNGTDWEPAILISEDVAPEEQRNPSIVARDMNVHVVWQDPEDGDDDIYYRYFDGAKWQTEREISTDIGAESQTSPSIAIDGNRIHFAWQDFEGGDGDIFYRCLNGTSWELEEEISVDIGVENQSNPSVAAWSGGVHVVWEDQGDGDADIYYRRFNGTDWEPEQEISNDSSNEPQLNPVIAAENGLVYVVWEDQGDGDADIYYRRFNGTDWEPEQEISSDSGSEWQETPSISVEDKKVYVVWSDNEGGDKDIYFRYLNVTQWETEMEISTDESGEEQGFPSIAVENGVSHIVWQDWEDGDSDIFYRRGRIKDFTSPESHAGPVLPYWRTTPSFSVPWTATDDYSLFNITLYFRYSPDNSSWSEWKDWGHDDSITGTAADGDFAFGASYGDGYYEFATVASDSSWNTEDGPPVADAVVGVDTLAPSGSITIDGGGEWSTSENATLSLTYSDSISGVSTVRYSNDGTWDSEPWEAPTASRAWTLATGDGSKTVYFQIRDSAGLESITYSDSIQLDSTAPTVVAIDPNDGATDVEVTMQIRVTFSEEMDEETTEDAFGLKTDSLDVEGSTSWSNDGRTLIFHPVDNLTYDTTYRIVLLGGQDIVGNALASSVEAQFETERSPDARPDAIGQYWWIVLLTVVLAVIVILVILVGRKRQSFEETGPGKSEDLGRERDENGNQEYLNPK
jgi:hypothetical protein